jgi:hypothetical protein
MAQEQAPAGSGRAARRVARPRRWARSVASVPVCAERGVRYAHASRMLVERRATADVPSGPGGRPAAAGRRRGTRVASRARRHPPARGRRQSPPRPNAPPVPSAAELGTGRRWSRSVARASLPRPDRGPRGGRRPGGPARRRCWCAHPLRSALEANHGANWPPLDWGIQVRASAPASRAASEAQCPASEGGMRRRSRPPQGDERSAA